MNILVTFVSLFGLFVTSGHCHGGQVKGYVQEPLPVQKPLPIQSPLPVQKPLPIQSPFPIQRPLPIQSPIQRPSLPVQRPSLPLQEPSPEPYQFSYSTGQDGPAQSFREETSNGQTVVGKYGYVDPYGKLRTVNYEATPDGFRATGDIGPDMEPVKIARRLEEEDRAEKAQFLQHWNEVAQRNSIPPQVQSQNYLGWAQQSFLGQAQPQRQIQSNYGLNAGGGVSSQSSSYGGNTGYQFGVQHGGQSLGYTQQAALVGGKTAGAVSNQWSNNYGQQDVGVTYLQQAQQQQQLQQQQQNLGHYNQGKTSGNQWSSNIYGEQGRQDWGASGKTSAATGRNQWSYGQAVSHQYGSKGAYNFDVDHSGLKGTKQAERIQLPVPQRPLNYDLTAQQKSVSNENLWGGQQSGAYSQRVSTVRGSSNLGLGGGVGSSFVSVSQGGPSGYSYQYSF